MYGLTDDELDKIVTILKSNHVRKAVLFGSRAKGNFKPGSDVDLAIIGDELKISCILNEETNLPYFFDVLNLDEITNQNLKDHVARVGQVIV